MAAMASAIPALLNIDRMQNRSHPRKVAPARPPTPTLREAHREAGLRNECSLTAPGEMLPAFSRGRAPIVEIANRLSPGRAAPPIAIAIAVPSKACRIWSARGTLPCSVEYRSA